MKNNLIKFTVFKGWVKIIMSKEEKLDELKKLNEEDFRVNVVLPLFRKIGKMSNVQSRHGNDESGIDIAYFEEDSLGTKHMVGVQLKVGDLINSPSSGKKNDITIIGTQLKAAFTRKHDFVEPRGKFSPKSMYVITNGKFSSGAKRQIVDCTDVSNEINFLDGEQILNLLEKHYPEYFSIKDKQYIDYYTQVYEKHRYLNEIRKFGSQKDLEFNDIFIEPDIVEENTDKELLNKKIKRISDHKRKYSCNEILESRKDFLITGDQGSGKSTLLQALLCKQILNNLKERQKGVIPVFIKVKDLGTCKYDILSAINLVLKRESGERIIPELKERLASGDMMLLFDSYSEILELSDKEAFEESIANFKTSYPNNSLIISSRDYDVTLTKKFNDLIKCRIAPFDSRKSEQLIRQWYKNSTTVLPDVAFQSVQRKINIGNFPRTPFVYTICLVLYEEHREEITSNVAELFEKYTELYLGKWDKELSIKYRFDFRTKHDYLSFIAYKLFLESRNTMSVWEFISEINKRFEKKGLDEEGEELLEEIVNSGIVKRSEDNVEFAFHTLQEFFAAKYLLAEGLENEIIESYNNPSWALVIIYYAGLKRNCTNLISEILSRDNIFIEQIEERDLEKVSFFNTYLLGGILQNADQSDEDVKIESLKLCLQQLSDLHLYIQKENNDHKFAIFVFTTLLASYLLGTPKMKNQYLKLIHEFSNDDQYDLCVTFLSIIICDLGIADYTDYLKKISKSQDLDVLLFIIFKTRVYLDDRKGSIDAPVLKKIQESLESRLKPSRAKIREQYRSLL